MQTYEQWCKERKEAGKWPVSKQEVWDAAVKAAQDEIKRKWGIS